MAFDFGGSFNLSQLDRQFRFVDGQRALLTDRIRHINYEMDRVGVIKMQRDENHVPTSYSVDITSYLGKLVTAYVVMGGDPYYDLNIRASDEPVTLVKGTETSGTGTVMSNGETVGAAGNADKQTALLMRDIRKPFEATIRARRDYLERKIRRALDYYDQLNQEVQTLGAALGSADVTSSLDQNLETVIDLIKDPLYRAAYDDASNPDPLGLGTRAPFAALEPGGTRQAPARGERTSTGFNAGGKIPT